MRAIIISVLFFWTSISVGETVISKTASLSLEEMEKLLTLIGKAEEYTEYMYIQPLKSLHNFEEDFVLSCPIGFPDSGGLGCILGLSLASTENQGFNMSIRKNLDKLHLQKSIKEMKAKISQENLESSEVHLHVGNPLSARALETDSTHWYCYANGEVGSKSWKCEIYLMERLGIPVANANP